MPRSPRRFSRLALLCLLAGIASIVLLAFNFWRNVLIGVAIGPPLLRTSAGAIAPVLAVWVYRGSLNIVAYDARLNHGSFLLYTSAPDPIYFTRFAFDWDHSGNTWLLGFPLALPAAAFTALAWLLHRRHRTHLRRANKNLCPTCGYDLRATPQRCPECGTPSPQETPSPAKPASSLAAYLTAAAAPAPPPPAAPPSPPTAPAPRSSGSDTRPR